MITVAKATSVDYYTSGGGVAAGMESYYLDAVTEGEPPGQWLGTGAAQLGLAGEVDPEMMKTLYGEFVDPLTGERLGSRPAKRAGAEDRLAAALAKEPAASPERIEQLRRAVEADQRSNVIGWDLTFAVPKSVTIVHTAAQRGELAARRDGDAAAEARFAHIRVQVEDAIAEANAAGIAAAEQLATSRAGGGSGSATRWVKAPKLAVASFFQHTNRSIDPHLHVHNVVLNRVFCDDGKVRALDGQDLLKQRFAFSAVADRALTESLAARLGLTFRDRPDGAGREIAIVPEEVIDHFSTRARQTTAAMVPLVERAEERLGRALTAVELSRLHREAQRSSRAPKTHDGESEAELSDRWLVELANSTGRSMSALGDLLVQVTRDHIDRTETAPEGSDSADQAQAENPPTAVAGLTSGWSPRAVIAEAVAACAARDATWGRANLISEIELHLPVLGIDVDQVSPLLEHLADQALADPDVVQLTGFDTGSYAAPSATLYAAAGTLEAEAALRRSAIERGRHHLERDDVAAWLDTHCPDIGADQRAAVEGIAASDAALSVLIGPAGTGKSYAAGALAGAWQQLNGGQGRVIGLAVSQVATMVLRDDGIEAARNIAQWLSTQTRITEADAAGAAPHAADRAWKLAAADVVLVDEASMVSTADLEQIRGIVDAAGARMVLAGDPRQLGAVEAGGVMGLLDGHAETYTLTEVRRFAADWERAASLALRDGDAAALDEYDRHARLLPYQTVDDATAATARAAVADRVDGRSVVVVAASNERAAAVSSEIRDQLIDLGLVDPGNGVTLGRDGNTASVGDVITCRRNDYALGVTNRIQYTVLATGTPGGADAEHQTSASAQLREGELLVEAVPIPGREQPPPVLLPAGYVAADAQLGYASTVHAAEGLTVDACHHLTGGGTGTDHATLYVATTRGRLRNTVHVALATPRDQPSAAAADTARGGQYRVEDTSSAPTARSVLQAALDDGPAGLRQRPASGVAATVAAEQAAAREASIATITARLDTETRQACRARTERHLDDLAHAGLLDDDIRGRLGADQGTEHLTLLLRALEQAGADPFETLAQAVRGRGLHDANSVAQVLAHRITGGKNTNDAVGRPLAGTEIPADIPTSDADRLAQLHNRAAERAAVLGAQAADDAPEWAVQSLGPVPDPHDTADRADWEHRAGIVAAHREAVGWDHPSQALDRMPGLSTTERRSSFAAAWHALGEPEDRLDEAAMTDGQILARITTWRREQEWAPAYVDDDLRHAETEHDTARQAAAVAEARAEQAQTAHDHERAAQLRAEAAAQRTEAEYKAAVVAGLTKVAEARGLWAAATMVSHDFHDRALPEAERRGLAIGHEPDRTTATAYLDEHAAVAADDAHRTITEDDLDHVHPDDDAWNAGHPIAQDGTPPDAGPTRSIPELDLMVAGSALAVDRLTDRASEETAHSHIESEQLAIEAQEAARRRRAALDVDAEQLAARTAGSSEGSGWDD